jgi:hypothetical protein
MTMTTLARVFGAAAHTSSLSPFSLHRPLSTTARLAKTSRPRAQTAWPPLREDRVRTTTPSETAAKDASPSSSSSAGTPATPPPPTSPASPSGNPLNDMYKSDSPAQWANWSSNDFQERNRGLGGLRNLDTGGLSATSSRSGPDGGTRVFLGPITGRTVYVGGNVDPFKAFLFVNVMCSRNQVPQDFQKQRFHERPGLRRKRVRIEVREREFKRSFKATIARVQKLKMQGW